MRATRFAKLILLFILIASLTLTQNVFAATTLIATSANVPTFTIYEYDFDQLVFDFTLKTMAEDDYLKALTLMNVAPYSNFGITKMCLYHDAGATGFQGWGTDLSLGCGTWYGTDNVWYWDNLNLQVGESGARLFAVIDTDQLSTNLKYIQIGIPEFLDNDNDGMFDQGDRGFFTLKKQNGPVTQTLNSSIIYLKYFGNDTNAPKAIFTNLKDNQEITDDSYLITGEAKDRGYSGVSLVEISINSGAWKTVTTSDNYAHWKYDWKSYVDGLYVIKLRTTDNIGMGAISDGVVVSVNRKNRVSIEKSTFVINKTTIFANGTDYVAALVTAKNSSDDVLNNKNVTLLWAKMIDGVKGEASETTSTTNENGQALFKIKSKDLGKFNLEIKIEGMKLNGSETVEFIEESIDYTNGSLIRWSDSKTVYFLDKNNVRHPYPTQGVYASYWGNNFKMVKILSIEEISQYEIGKNVPFKIGTLMKIQTVPKVYRVGVGETKNWITTEAVAQKLYGANWNKLIYDLPEIFFTDYKDGPSITS
ncbi:hypothetical protein HY932_03080 [Candidatus Falkowbacteria bacterium]|nr:hypothetical protein [Candidatus Falkowbacteria bacterium]